jgi:UDP-N-acetylmuramate--alanine ligase
MLPLAYILKGLGHTVSGSDRSRDQGRTPDKFTQLEKDGFSLFPQDGSGVGIEVNASPACALTDRPDFLVVSAAVEDTVPDVKAAKDAGIPILRRADLLAQIFNAFPKRIAVGGTSGKTTTTGMIAHILKSLDYDPVVMCGGVMKNYGVSALTGKGDVFVTESDESDGSIALYNPDVSVLTNISVDHKGLDELRALFGDFVKKSRVSIVNADNLESAAVGGTLSYGLEGGTYTATDIFHFEEGASAVITNGKDRAAISLEVPGAHNLSNALAAIAAVSAYGVSLKDACDALSRFTGIKRRMEYVGEGNGVTVIDDFAHNPDKIAATLSALKNFPGRLLIIFQMHGYGPLKLMWQDLAQTFRGLTGDDDRIFMPDPLYLGGTADKSIGTKDVVAAIGPKARWFESRKDCGEAALSLARPGDRIVVMGARDDSLSDFAHSLLKSLQ